jgi:peroxiredoxin
VRAHTDGDVAFIQQEIFEDNQVDKGVRSQVAKWKLPTEPWTFVIDREGIVQARFEGAFSAGELQRAVAKVL